MKKLLVSLMLIIYSVVAAQSVTSLDPSQVYNTVNIVNNTTAPTNTTGTWQNIGLWNQGLPCWGPGGPVYCGPLPYFNNGSFNFSYGTTDVYQTANVANSLPGSGAGLRVNGYNFSFMAKNGNGWDDGRQDYLIAYTRFWDAQGTEKFFKIYDLNQNIGSWFNYSFNETFTTPFATKDLGLVQYGFVGRDNNYWAGPYGPEVTNVSFSLKYSVDPCYVNVLSSPTCPGYMDALNKLISPASSTPTTVTSTTTTATTTVTTTITDDPTNPTVTVTSTPSTTVSSTTSAATSGAAAATTSKSTSPSASTSLGLSVIAKNQQREQNIVSSVVQSAIGSAADAAAVSMQEAQSIAASATANSSSATVTGSQIGLSVGPKTSSTGLSFGLGSGAGPGFGSDAGTAMVYNNMLLDRTNPLNDYVDHKPVMSTGPVFSGPSVNRNAANNEAAGGVDINKIALAPVGYNDYLNLVIKDAAFYAPKEVYKNQRNVDNARALRQMSSDKLHQEMIEQQYRR